METLLPPTWKQDIERWLVQDLPAFDIGGYLVGTRLAKASLYCKSDGILAGLPFVNEVFEYLDCTVTWLREEGEKIEIRRQGKVKIASVAGPAKQLLVGERLALNILARCSGVATKTANMVEKVRQWKGKIAATRKTTPGFSLVEKYGVLIGGGSTHRMNLSQSLMIKDNHLWVHGGEKTLLELIAQAKTVVPHTMKIEVEVRNEKEALECCRAGVEIVMLDNFHPTDIQSVSKKIKREYPNVIIEASGGITSQTIHLYACPTVDIISQGQLTYNYDIVDYSMKLDLLH